MEEEYKVGEGRLQLW